MSFESASVLTEYAGGSPPSRAITAWPKQAPNPDRVLRWVVWAYFLLLIFEGALRKWFLPGLATPLLVIRDPLALWLMIGAWKRGQLPSNPHLNGMLIVGFISLFTALLLGHGSLPVAIYGARILLLHVPLVFVIGRLLTREDVVLLGKVTLWITLPMTLLIALQFYSPQSAWVNRGIGGDTDGIGFSGAGEFFRPPGTFSFTNGNTLFYSFAAAFIFYFLMNPKGVNRMLLLGATACLLIAIPLSISRGLFFSVAVTMIFAVIAISRNPKYVGRLIMAAVIGVLTIALLSKTAFFQTASDAFSTRFETANESEGGLHGVLVERYIGRTLGSIVGSSEQPGLPFFGYGIGLFTNVGMSLAGVQAAAVYEVEWGRAIAELGPLLGIIVVFMRIGLSFRIARACYRQLVQGEFLPWMLLSFGLLIIPQGVWAQPTSLGFYVIIGGIIIASLKKPAH